MTERTTDIMIAVAAAVWNVWRQNHQHQTSTRLWPSSSRFLSWKVQDCYPGTGFCTVRFCSPRCRLIPGLYSKWRGRHKDNPPAALFARYCHSGLVLLSESEDRASWYSVVPREIKTSWDGVIWTVPDHDGGRPNEINAWFLYTHMVYL